MSKINYNSKEKLYKINNKHYIFNNAYISYLLLIVSFILKHKHIESKLIFVNI